MTPIKQTITGDKGNCLQACVASILDKPLEEVPHFICYGENWFLALILFMRDFGYEYEGTGTLEESENYEGIDEYVIGCGMSPRGRHHATIYKKGKMVHDPHPDNSGIEFEYCYFFKPFGEVREPLNYIIR